MSEQFPAPTKFKIWYMHQIGGPAYEQPVDSAEEGQKILDAIYQVALYLYQNRMAPDYANTGGITYWDEVESEWFDYDPEDWA